MIIDDYLNYLDEYRKKYGENTIIIIQVGSFFELYDIDINSKYLYKIADICNIQISRKNKSILEVSRNNPIMCGFPLYVINKYIQLILQNNYTIVLIEQVTEPPEPQRKITEILSPATNININSKKSNYIMVLYYEEIDNLLIVGITGVDLSTGRSFIYENGTSKSDPQYTLDESYRLITTYNPCEILILSDDNIKEETKKQILNIINSNSCLIHKKWNNYELNTHIKKIDYQNKILEKSFMNKTMLSIIEYLNLEKYSLGRLSFCCLLQFAYEHNNDIIKELKIPELLDNSKNLSIEYNSALQLNIISNNSNEKPLLDILNRCNTAFGSRIFKERFLNPINNKKELIDRYNNIENYLSKYKEINKFLVGIIDLERIKRKMVLKKIQPCEWGSFASSLENAIEVFKITEPDIIINVNNIIQNYSILNLDECSKYNANDIKTNIFNIGIYKKLDDLNEDYKKAYNIITNISNSISKIGDTLSKIEFNDSEGYYITITKKRFETASKIDKKFMDKFEKKLITTNNTYKLTSNDIKNASNTIRKTQTDINLIVTEKYNESINKCLNLTCRIDYHNSKEKHENFIENPDKYFLNKGVWINWCDFLGYDTSLFIPTKQKWLNFCKEKGIKTIEDYNKLSLIHIELPKDPEDFYNSFSNIANELQLFNNKKRR